MEHPSEGGHPMKEHLVLRLYGLLLILSFVWVLLGAPLHPQEWQDVPHRLGLMFSQLPRRICAILALWR